MRNVVLNDYPLSVLHARFRLGHNKERISNKQERRLGFNSRLWTYFFPPPLPPFRPPLLYPFSFLILGSWTYIVYPPEGRPRFSVFTCHLDDDRDEGILRVPGVPSVLDAVQGTNTYRCLGPWLVCRVQFFMSLLAHANYPKVLKITCRFNAINRFNSKALIRILRNHILTSIRTVNWQ